MLATIEKHLLICVSKFFHELSGIGIAAEKGRHSLDGFNPAKYTFSTELSGHFQGICFLNCAQETAEELANLMFQEEEDFEMDEEMVFETGMEVLNTVIGRSIGQLSREDLKIKMAPPEYYTDYNFVEKKVNLHIPFKTRLGYLHIILQSKDNESSQSS
ncbi:chemotaxis protein CheX [Candidatus Riflebacteria bacterium]